MSMTVRHISTDKLTEPQIKRIAELWRQLDDAENAYDAPHGLKMRHTSVNGLRQYLQRDNEGVTAAVGKDGKILGFARNFPAREYGNVNYISALSVDKDHRGQGIGRAILQNIVRSNRRKRRLSMLRVSLNNPAGLHLYGSMGFKPVSQTMVLGERQEKRASSDPVETLARTHYADDGAHGWGHIQDVLGRARSMKGSPLSSEERAACLFHDSSLMTGPRETHADDSAVIARQELRRFFRRRQLERIAKAISRHRASYKGRRYTGLDNLLAAADRSDLNLEKMVHRCYDYRRENGWTDDGAIFDDTISHITDKYGRNGYALARAPKIYLDSNSKQLEAFWKRLESLKREDVARIVGQSNDAEVKTAQLKVTAKSVIGLVRDALKTPRTVARNAVSAARAGQFPIPGITICAKHKNVPFKVKPGDPVFFGMTGAGPWSDLPQMAGMKTGYTTPARIGFKQMPQVSGMRPENTHLYRWFDREQALADIRKFVKDHPDNPVYTFGHSYGGVSMADVVRRLGGKKVSGLVMHDPVGWFPGKAPELKAGKPVSLYPDYQNPAEPGNLVADVGGRIRTFEGAENRKGVLGGSHVVSAPSIADVLRSLVGRRK